MGGATWDQWFVALLVLAVLAVLGWGSRVLWARTTWRRRGRWFAEGWYEVQHQRRQELQLEYKRGVEDTLAGRIIKAPAPQAPAGDRTPTDPDVHAQYTITGKRLR